MRTLLTIATYLTGATAALAWGPLAEPGEEAQAERILDIRSPEDFAKGHLPGAVNAPYGDWRGPADNPGELIDTATLQQLLRDAGVEDGQDILIVHQGDSTTDFGAAARVYWTLKSAGLDSLAVLNGGYADWVEAGNSPSTEAASVEPTEIDVTWDNSWTIDRAGVAEVVDGKSGAVLIDARPHEFFTGETKHDAASRPGTLAGALNLVNTVWFGNGDPRIDAPQEMIDRVKALAAENGDAPLVSFCNTGHWAATNWFAASELAGIEGVRLYPESMVGWTLFGGDVAKGTN
ncbi:sulfurtransferase [Halovulum sp. GXIMD14794]